MNQQILYYSSPVGILEVKGTEEGIESVGFVNEIGMATDNTILLHECIEQLDEYFQGKRKEFSVKLNLKGSVFQKRIWAELLKIPFGSTISYLELAMKYGDVKTVRAVGLANAKNPVAILVPCHRVIGASGELTGYAGGLQRKKWLLELEGSLHPDLFSATKAL